MKEHHTEHEHENDQEIIPQQELEQEIEWMRALLTLEEKDLPLPESLRSEHLLDKIKDIVPDPPESEHPTGPKKGKVLFFKIASCAACLALVLFGWRQMSSDGAITQSASSSSPAAAETTLDLALPEAAPAEEEIYALTSGLAADDGATRQMPVELPEQPVAADYSEVYDAVAELYQRSAGSRSSYSNRAPFASPAPTAGANEAMPVVDNPATAGAGNMGVSSTNVQIAGIDEADIVKTDGVYLYQYRFDQETGGAKVSIVAANGLRLLSTIELPDYSDAELYVTGDRMVLVQTAGEERVRELLKTLAQDDGSNAADSDVIVPDYIEPEDEREIELIDMVETVVYDLTDRKSPKEQSRYLQDGRYVSSRLSGDHLYLVTNKDIYRFRPDDGATPLPRYLPIIGENGQATALDAGSILLPPYRENMNYAVVSALNLTAQSRETKAVLGMAEQIMMSKDTLFLAAAIPTQGGSSRWDNNDTGITRFAVSGGTLGYLSSGRVPGRIDGQFSLDEHNGNLRIATTSYDEQGETVNNVFVYDEKMEQIGGIEGLAPGERIYSARFLGDTAYVVTFRQVDPLFVIDLSNPKKPVVKGELKIPGFSEYLHPIDENTLIGVGVNTIYTEWGGTSEDGLKLSLFDVSNPTDPRELSSFLLGNSGSRSEALTNHKAFLCDASRRIIGFPATIRTSVGASISRPWSGDNRVTFSGYLLFSVGEDGFELIASFPSESGEDTEGFYRTDIANSIERGVYIGKTFYTVAPNRIRAYSLDTFEQIGELVY